jgi:hypothetical protein
MTEDSSPDRPVVVGRSSPDRPEVVPRSRQKSRITNGSALLPDIDGRSPWIRRCKDIIAAHISDLGGEDNTSEAERSIIRRAAVLSVELERLELTFAQAGAADRASLDLYSRVASNLRRLLEAVGLERRSRDLTPTLADIQAEYAAKNAAARTAEQDGNGSP